MARTRRIVYATVAIAVFLTIAPAAVYARPITLVWDPSPGPEVAGYTVFYGTESGIYTNSVIVGNLTSCTIDLAGDQYYFAVQAYSADGETSGLSEAVAESSVIALAYPPDQTDAPGDHVSLQLVATGSPVLYTATNLPAGLGLNPVTGRIGGAISSAADSLSYIVSASVSDGSGHTSSVQFMWTVIHVNRAPSLEQPATQRSAAGIPVTLPIIASDSDGDGLLFSAAGLPPGLIVDAVSGIVSGRVAFGAVGTYDVTITVADGNLSANASFTWTVWVPGGTGQLAVDQVVSVDSSEAIATTPAFSTSNPGEILMAFAADDGPAGSGLTMTVSGADLTWSLVGRANVQDGTAEIWIAAAEHPLADVTVTAVGSPGYPQSLTVVTFSGAAGVGAVAGASAPSGAPGALLTTTQPGSLAYAVGNDWDAASARSVGADQTMVHEYLETGVGNTFWVQSRTGSVPTAGTQVEVNDTAPTDHQWNVVAVEVLAASQPASNRAPTLTEPTAQRSHEHATVSLQLEASDPDGDSLTYGATGLPPSLTIDAATGRISGILSYASAGIYHVTATVSDGSLSDSETFTWRVFNVNRPPNLTDPPAQRSHEHDSVSLQLEASDPDGDSLTYHAWDLPHGLTINATTGLISGVLSYRSAGTYLVTVSVSDGSLWDREHFKWTVKNVNRPPTLTAPPNQTSTENKTVSLRLVASDPDHDDLTYSAKGLPPPLTVDHRTGLISGVLSRTSAGIYSVTATASDGRLKDSKTFTWTVLNVNRPPTLTPSPDQNTAAGTTLTLAIVASDPDGDRLTFSATGLPPGLRIDAATGAISGRLPSDTAGTWHVCVTVSDGHLSKNDTFTWTITRRR